MSLEVEGISRLPRVDQRIAQLRLSLPFAFRLHDDDQCRTEYGSNRFLWHKKNWEVLDILQVRKSKQVN